MNQTRPVQACRPLVPPCARGKRCVERIASWRSDAGGRPATPAWPGAVLARPGAAEGTRETVGLLKTDQVVHEVHTSRHSSCMSRIPYLLYLFLGVELRLAKLVSKVLKRQHQKPTASCFLSPSLLHQAESFHMLLSSTAHWSACTSLASPALSGRIEASRAQRLLGELLMTSLQGRH